jgi:hypothetical protein
MLENDLYEKINDVKRAIERIEFALAGDPRIGQEGLVTRLSLLEETVDTHSKIVLTVKAQIFTACSIASAVGWLLFQITNWFFAGK